MIDPRALDRRHDRVCREDSFFAGRCRCESDDRCLVGHADLDHGGPVGEGDSIGDHGVRGVV